MILQLYCHNISKENYNLVNAFMNTYLDVHNTMDGNIKLLKQDMLSLTLNHKLYFFLRY